MLMYNYKEEQKMNRDSNIIILLLAIILLAGAILAFRVIGDLNGQVQEATVQNSTQTETNIYNLVSDPISLLDSQKSDLEKFNYDFERYQGEQNGTMTRGLVNTTYQHNIEGSQKVIIEYNGNIYSEDNDIKNLKSSISMEDTYSISLEYNSSTQYVEKVIIK